MFIPSVEPVPLKMNEHGVVLVSGTRVPMDTIIGAFKDGATPQDIARSYDSVSLADIFAVIAYYLHHKDEVDSYLERRQREKDTVRRDVEARFDPEGVRERLLARRKKPE